MTNYNSSPPIEGIREIVPNLWEAQPEAMEGLLVLGTYLGFHDFTEACATLEISLVNASRAFNTTVAYLLRRDGGKDQYERRRIEERISWTGGYNPNQLGYRNRLLIATQAVVNLVVEHQEDVFDDTDAWFTKCNWRVLRAAVWDDVEVEFVREDRETRMQITSVETPL